jgi:hypothetical protein
VRRGTFEEGTDMAIIAMICLILLTGVAIADGTLA